MKKRSGPDIVSRAAARLPAIAFPFLLEALDDAGPTTRPLFGSTAVYLGERVFFILRKKGDADDGVWVAFDEERERDALSALPNLQRIRRLPNVRSWRKLAAASPTFEDDVLEACRIARTPGGPIGKIPIRQKAKKKAPTKQPPKKKAPSKQPPKKKTAARSKR